MIDHGSRAPALAFVEAFAARGVAVTEAEEMVAGTVLVSLAGHLDCRGVA